MKTVMLLLCCCLWFTAAPLQAHEATETAADVMRVLLPVTAYTLTFLQDDPEGRPQFYKSFLSTVGATYLLKVAIDAERPNGGGRSFPSGHASMAFSGAAFMQQRYGWFYGLPAYLAASFVGWSRVDSGDHRVGDVLAGAAFGFSLAYFFTDRFGDENLQLVPVFDNTAVGIRLEGIW
jgi:membrane-associated phospholipid phosphatase